MTQFKHVQQRQVLFLVQWMAVGDLGGSPATAASLAARVSPPGLATAPIPPRGTEEKHARAQEKTPFLALNSLAVSG